MLYLGGRRTVVKHGDLKPGLTKVGLARLMGLSEGAVRKLPNPNHRSHVRQVEHALRKVGRRLVVEDGVA